MQEFLVLAGLSEAVTQVVIQIVEGIQKKSEDWWKMPVACLFAAVLLYATTLNIFFIMGVPLRIGGELQVAFSSFFGGVLVGRWGSALNDVLDGIRGISDKAKAEGDKATA
jgi:hypothetical protein